MSCKHLSWAACLMLTVLGISSVRGAESLRIIIPTPPGGGTDGYFRVLAKEAGPLLIAQLAVAMNVRAGTTTSSPAPMSSARNASSSATVPFASAIA